MMGLTAASEPLDQFEQISGMLERLRGAGWLPKKEASSEYASCLPALVCALGVPIELTQLCEALPHRSKQIDLIDIQNTMANLGYVAQSARVRLCDIDERLMPCLFEPDNTKKYNTMVVLGKTTTVEGQPGLSVYCGQREEILRASARRTMRGTAYFFTKEEDVSEATQDALGAAAGFSWFRSLLQRFKGIFWQVFALSVVVGLLSLSAPLLVMLVYDQVIGSRSQDTLSPLLVGASIALLTEWSLRSFRSRSLAWFGARLDYIVSNKIFEQLMMMPPIYTERAAVAPQIARLKAFEAVRDFFTSPLFLAVIELPFTLIILLAIGLIAGPVVWVPIITAALYVGLLVWIHSKLKAAIRLAAKSSNERQNMAIESFQKMPSLRASGLTSSWFRQFREHSGKASMAGFRSTYLAAVIETLAHGLFILAGMVTIVWSIELVWAGEMTSGALIACMILVWRVLGPFQTFCTSLPRFEQLKNAVNQVNRMMTIKTERMPNETKARVTGFEGKVSFSRVGLRYTKETDPVFTGLSFEAKPGQLIAITGGNGSGKTSVLKLINGLYRPQAGKVAIDGVDIRQLDPIELRQHIAYVPQKPDFFQGTIVENLRFAEPLATDQALQSALEQVGAWDDICNLPKGLDTPIGQGHASLPTSLAYRLNLTRAYIKNSTVMLFDELPYALLNSPAGEAFQSMLNYWKGQRTLILVTHRGDYMKMADHVVLLGRGSSPLVGDPDTIIEAIHRSNEVA